jgi:hypothetical protein
MACTPSSFQFSTLVQPTSSVTPTTTPPRPFDAGIAYLMGQCCALTYSQFDTASISTSDFSTLVCAGSYAGFSVSASNLTQFTVSEANEPGPTPGNVGDYFTVPGGFGVLLTLTKGGQPAQKFTVIALRGTRTFAEWLTDATALPTPFAGVTGTNDGLGSVHSGFYGFYTTGTNGAIAASGQELSKTVSERAKGSLARQVGDYVQALNGAEIYVTGHSLGGALATLCSLDIAYNFPAAAGSLSLYTLASPRVAVGLSDTWGISIPTMSNQAMFQGMFQSLVPNAYQIVNAADIIPALPPLSTSLGQLVVSCTHVTDPWTANNGSGATLTAQVSGGKVTGVTVTKAGSGYAYLGAPPPPVILSGGGGYGAVALATVGSPVSGGWGTITGVTVLNGGWGYTSAPTATVAQSGNACADVVSFCAQSGDVGNNHGCVYTYVPYLAALAAGFA